MLNQFESRIRLNQDSLNRGDRGSDDWDSSVINSHRCWLLY